jgi:hypothetical protein
MTENARPVRTVPDNIEPQTFVNGYRIFIVNGAYAVTGPNDREILASYINDQLCLDYIHKQVAKRERTRRKERDAYRARYRAEVQRYLDSVAAGNPTETESF